jgi:hypothetical protein
MFSDVVESREPHLVKGGLWLRDIQPKDIVQTDQHELELKIVQGQSYTHIFAIESAKAVQDFGDDWRPCNDVFVLTINSEFIEITENANSKPEINLVLFVFMTT